MKNYVHFKEFSLLYDHYAFIDVPQYYADQLFIRHQVRVYFGEEMGHSDQPYIVIFCKVKKRDRDRFLAALSDLERKMIVCGYPEYETACESIIALMSGQSKPLPTKEDVSK